MLITLAEYARRLGKTHQTVRQKVVRGTLNAQKIGHTWMIEENEPYDDMRFRDSHVTEVDRDALMEEKKSLLSRLEKINKLLE